MAPTNRGNKMHANAKYVSEGALGYINAEYYYKHVRGLPIPGLGRCGDKMETRILWKLTFGRRLESRSCWLYSLHSSAEPGSL